MVLTGVVKDLDGKDVDLASFKGKVCLIVNVASNCGYTHQYVGLEALYAQKKDQGFVILAFPANDFLGQEPGTAAQIKEVCYGKYKVTFPMFAKVSVVGGPEQAALYKQIAAQPAPVGGDPKWNFTKFLVDRNGNVIERFEPRIRPSDAVLLAAIDRELAKKGGETATPEPAPASPPAEGGK
ncbi:MAG: glutathione peroxidase [Leptolyngbya sp. PLA1]|nr:glutathione peroxidase [Leptolyngbya sp. PLA1]